MSNDLTLHQLHDLLLGSLHAALGCEAVFCYAGWSSGDRVASGAMLTRDTVTRLPERPLQSLLVGAARTCQVWARSDSCIAYAPPCSILDVPAPPALSHALGAYLLRNSRCVGVIGASVDPRAANSESYPAKLLQVGAALATLIGLHNESRGLLAQTSKRADTVPAGASQTTRTLAAMRGDESAPSPTLSKREQEIAYLLVSGYAAVNVAAILSISEHTVRTYIRRMYRKLGVTNRAELVRQCVGMTSYAVVAQGS